MITPTSARSPRVADTTSSGMFVVTTMVGRSFVPFSVSARFDSTSSDSEPLHAATSEAAAMAPPTR